MTDPLEHWIDNPPGASETPPVGEAARRLQRRSTILDWFQIATLALIPVVLFLAFRMDNRAQHADARAERVADTVAAFRELVLCNSPSDCAEAREKLATLGQPSVIVLPSSTIPGAATTTTTLPAQRLPPSTAPAASPGRSPSTTGARPSPPATAAPAPSKPPSQPPSSTTTTTAPCLAVVLGHCVP